MTFCPRRTVPFLLPTFVTPSFPAYASGHSTFSRAAAEVLAAFTGSPYFPGGLASYTTEKDGLLFEQGPMGPVAQQYFAGQVVLGEPACRPRT